MSFGGGASNNGVNPREMVDLTVNISRATSRILGKRGTHIIGGYIASGGRVGNSAGWKKVDVRQVTCNMNEAQVQVHTGEARPDTIA